MDWNALQPEASVEDRVARVKDTIPTTFVIDAEGYEVEALGGKYVCASPFREDSNPSFDLYSDREDGFVNRWGDFAAEEGGDVIDLYLRFYPDATWIEALNTLEKATPHVEAWEGPKLGEKAKTFNAEAARTHIEESWAHGEQGLTLLFSARRDYLSAGEHGAELNAHRIASIFSIGYDVEANKVIVPYYDIDDRFVALKTRTPGEHMMAVPGTQYGDVLYGEHLTYEGDPRTVVLCEGESDVWSGTIALPTTEYVVLGLPTGAGSHPKQAPRLAGRRVLLAFDGDTAGRGAAQRWMHALLSEGCQVGIVPIPSGKDLSTVEDPLSTVRSFRMSSGAPLRDVVHHSGAYWRIPATDKQDPKQLSDFEIDMEEVLRDEHGALSYAGTMKHKEVVLPAAVLTSAARLRAWASVHGASWVGSDGDTPALASLLEAESLFAPLTNVTGLSGLHDDVFVWPGNKLGRRQLRHYSENSIGTYNISETDPVDVASTLRNLLALHDPDVVQPILAWLAVAPLRSKFKQFPALNVFGSSGSGKTTLLEAMVSQFSGSSIAYTLSGTTPYALQALLGCTNGFPVWIDEYRPGARPETKSAFDQFVRDAYTMQPSIKGGGKEHWSETVSFVTTAPVIVSGEDAFQETSHMERMVLVKLPIEGKNPEALTYLQSATNSIAYTYLLWLLYGDGLNNGLIPEDTAQVTPYGPENLSPRYRYNLGVLRYGWDLLRWFDKDLQLGLDLANEPDLSALLTTVDAANRTDPVREAIVEALAWDDHWDSPVWLDDDGVLNVRVQPLLQGVERKTDIVMPGRSAAIKSLLVDKYQGYEHQVTAPWGKRVRVVQLDPHMLGLEL